MIETERLILRPQLEADFEALCTMWADPDVVRFVGGVASTPEQTWGRLVRSAGMWSMRGFGQFAVLDKLDGRLLGEVGHADYHRGLGERFDPYPEAGWALASQAHGKGYASEAVAAAHRWFDENRPERRSVCIISPDNAASLRVAERVGYRPFGRADYRGEVIMLERIQPAL